MNDTQTWTLAHTATIMGFTLLTFGCFSVAIYIARQFDKDEPINLDNNEKQN